MTLSPLLVKASPEREICNITPESAGWKHVGFRALRLRQGDCETMQTATRELCVVVLTGKIRAQVDGVMFDALGTRDSVFDDISPDALYIPGGKTVKLIATHDAEVALCTAPYVSSDKATQRLDGRDMRRTVRGVETNMRYVCDILMGDNPAADRLLVVEVVTPPSHSSSYPPHKHDTDSAGETVLEETYYHRIHPSQGFAFQRVYTDDRSLDEACVVENHDVVMVPRGYHPVVAPHGYRSYYLNVMAGPSRAWAFKNDPAHEWMLSPPPDPA